MSWLTKMRSFFSSEKVVKQDLSKMKLAELRAFAKSKGLKGYTNLRKAELLELLQRD